MGSQVVHNHNDFFRVRIVVFSHTAQATGEILPGAPLGCRDFPPVGKGFEQHKQIANAVAGALILILGWLSRLDGAGFPAFPDELPIRLVKAPHRTFFITGGAVDLQSVFPPFHLFGGRRVCTTASVAMASWRFL